MNISINVVPISGSQFTITQAQIVQGSFTIDRTSTSGNNLEIGSTTASECTFALNNVNGDFNNRAFEGATLSVTVDGSSYGVFYVDDVSRINTTINIVALDGLVKFDNSANKTAFGTNRTPLQVLTTCCSQCGITLGTTTDMLNTNAKINIGAISEDITYRDIISWVGELTATNAYMSDTGTLCMGWYKSTSSFALTPSNRTSSNMQGYAVLVTGVKIIDGETTYISGSEEYPIVIESNPIIEQDDVAEVMTAIATRLVGFAYQPFTATVLSSAEAIALRPMDAVTYEKDGTTYNTIITNTLFGLNRDISLASKGDSIFSKGYAKLTKAQMTALQSLQQQTELATQELQEQIDELKIGGTNILRGTKEMLLNANSGSWKYGAWYKSGTGAIETVTLTDSPVAGVTKGIKLTQTSVSNELGFAQGSIPFTSEQVTFSVWVKGSVGTKLRLQAWWKSGATEVYNTTLDTNEWVKLSYTPTMLPPNESVAGGYVYIENGQTELKELLVCAPKIEYGNQATDWSASPFDNTDLGDGRNMLLKSDVPLESTAYFLKSWNFGDVKPIENEVYTIQIKGHLSTDKQAFLLYNTTGSGSGQRVLGGGYRNANNASSPSWITEDCYDEQTGIYTAKLVAVVGTQANTSLRIYAYPNATSTDPNIIEWIKLERGTTPTGWSPAPEDIADDFTALTNYINSEISTIETQIDGKIETFYQTTDPSTSWTAEQKTEHTGDIWQNSSTGKTYRWNGSTWQEMTTMPPSAVIDTIDGKAQVFINQPTPPYSVGDLWFNSASSDIMTCVTARASGSYTANDWKKRNKYTDDTALNTFISGTYAMDKTNLQTQIDGKAETWYQSTDPSSAWTTATLKQQHTGDLWYNTSNNTTWYYNGTSWQQQNIPTAVFDEIDGKAQIFTSQPTVPYHVGDLWFNSASDEILTCMTARTSGSYTASDWVKRNKYTDDTAVENLEIGGRNYYIINSSIEGYMNASGTIVNPSATNKERTSDFIAVAEGEKITIQSWATVTSSQQLWLAYIFYKGDKTTLVGSRVAKYSTAGVGYLAYEDVEVPAEAEYIRCSARFFNDGKLKIEKGSKPTDWSPAPEDTQGEIDTLTTTTNTLTTTTNALTQTTQSLQEQINNLDIGGVNLLLDTNASSLSKVYADVNRYWSDSGQASNIPFEFVEIDNPPQPNIKYGIKGTVATTTTGRRGLTFYSSSTTVVGIPFQENQAYTISCYVKLISGTKAKMSLLANKGTSTNTEVNNQEIEGSGWQRIEASFTATGTSSTTANGRVYFGIRGTYQCEVLMCGFQLEKGEYATTYNRPFEGELAVQQLENYFWHDSAGAHVTSVEGDATTGYNTLIGSTAMDIRDGVTSLASFGSTTRIGTASGRNMLISPTALEARTGTTVDASFGATTIIGRTGTDDYNTYIDSSSLQLRKGTVPYVELDGYDREVAIGDMDFYRTRVGVGMVVVEGGENTTYVPPVPEAPQRIADQIARLEGHRTDSGSGASATSHMYGNLMLARGGYMLSCRHGWTGTTTYTSDYVEVEEYIGGSTGVANPSKLTAYGGGNNKFIYTDATSGIGIYAKDPKIWTVQPTFSIDWSGNVTANNVKTPLKVDNGTWNSTYIADTRGHENLICNGIYYCNMWFKIKQALPAGTTIYTKENGAGTKSFKRGYYPIVAGDGTIVGRMESSNGAWTLKTALALSSASYPSQYYYVAFARPLAE